MVRFRWHLPPAEIGWCDDDHRICSEHHAQLSLCGAPCRRTHQKIPEGRPKGLRKPEGRGLRADPRAQRGQRPPRGATTIVVSRQKPYRRHPLPPRGAKEWDQEAQVRDIPRIKKRYLSFRSKNGPRGGQDAAVEGPGGPRDPREYPR